MSEASEAANQALIDAISGPKRVKSDAGEVEQHGLGDLIDADRYTNAKDAASKARRGLRFTKLLPPGTD